jgi:hypothetical protein
MEIRMTRKSQQHELVAAVLLLLRMVMECEFFEEIVNFMNATFYSQQVTTLPIFSLPFTTLTNQSSLYSFTFF